MESVHKQICDTFKFVPKVKTYIERFKAAEEMDFRKFWTTYEDVVRRARSGKLAVADFQGTTATITNSTIKRTSPI